MERLSDTVVRLESFAGSDMEGNPLYKDYHGKEGSELMGSLLSYMSVVGPGSFSASVSSAVLNSWWKVLCCCRRSGWTRSEATLASLLLSLGV